MTKLTESKKTEKSIIFLHIPKVGGTTVNKIIDRQYKQNTIYRIRTDSRKRIQDCVDEFKVIPSSEKERIKVVMGHMGFGLHDFLPQPSVYITLLRDPIERTISYYYYVLRKSNHYLHQKVTYEKMSLEDCINTGISTELDNSQTRILSASNGDSDSTVPFGQCNEEMLEKAKKNLQEHFIGVGLVESFDKSLLLFKKLLNWNNTFYLKRNVTKSRPLQSDFSQETLNLIKKQNEFDIELYKYASELFNQQVAQQGSSFEKELQKFDQLNSLYGNTYGRLYSLASSTIKKFKNQLL
ncbi:MAG: sulfotransferase family 2 domain-containing protein [Cyanobacteria bacterium P01_A01_bin.83]